MGWGGGVTNAQGVTHAQMGTIELVWRGRGGGGGGGVKAEDAPLFVANAVCALSSRH